MSKKKRKGRKHRVRVSEAHSTRMETVKHIPEPPRPSVRMIERSPTTRVIESSERHQYARAEIKRSLIIGGAMFTMLIILYVIFG